MEKEKIELIMGSETDATFQWVYSLAPTDRAVIYYYYKCGCGYLSFFIHIFRFQFRFGFGLDLIHSTSERSRAKQSRELLLKIPTM